MDQSALYCRLVLIFQLRYLGGTTHLERVRRTSIRTVSGSEDPPAVDQRAAAPDPAASLADQPGLPGILVHLSDLTAHNPGRSLGQPTLTVATWPGGTLSLAQLSLPLVERAIEIFSWC